MKKVFLFICLLIFIIISGCITTPCKSSLAKYHYYFDKEEYRQAINAALKFIKEHPQSPKNAEALLIIGKSNARLGIMFRTRKYLGSRSEYAEFLEYFKQAEQAYQKIITDYPKSFVAPTAQLHLGKMFDVDPYGGLNLFDRAIVEYQKAIKNYPGSGAAKKAQERLNLIQHQY